MPAPYVGLSSVSYGLPRPHSQQSVDVAPAQENTGRRAYGMIVLVATLAVLPIVFRGNPWGHDVNLHLRSWMDAARQAGEGTLFPRWAAGANMGFGEPFFVFYPPLSRLVGMSLGLLLPWKIVSGVYIWLMLILAGVSMWKCASEWLAPAGALLAGLLFTLNPYLLIIAYKRGNYADLLACSLLPLLVWGGIRIATLPAQTMLPLTVVFAALWLSDLPAAVVASYSLALLLVIGAVAGRALRPLIFGAIAIVTAFGSIAFYLLPAAWERRWVSIAEAVRLEWAPEHNFLFTHNNLPQYVAFNHGLSYIAVFLIVGTMIAAVTARQLREKNPSLWFSMTALALVSSFMMFSPSLFLYKILPQMEYVEFPWRWLSPLCVAGTFLVASACSQVQRKWVGVLIAAVLVIAVDASIVRTTNWDTAHYLEGLVADAHSPTGYPIRFGDWSNPVGSQLSRLDKAAPLVTATEGGNGQAVAQDYEFQVEQWQGARKVISVRSAHPLLLKLRLLSYPAWRASLDGKPVALQSDSNGLLLLPVPAGSSRAEIAFGRTWDRTVGNVISVVTILIGIALMWWWRKRETTTEAAN